MELSSNIMVLKDHPRLCGEKLAACKYSISLSGSPPPMRGKALSVSGCNRGCQDHPRLCGEKYIIDSNYNMVAGSPPPMRGKGGVNVKFSAQLRITPAYAGKSLTVLAWCCHNRDHPRLCGEKDGFISNIDPEWGSPPPMRGKVPKMDPMQGQSRITPAYAGKSA